MSKYKDLMIEYLKTIGKVNNNNGIYECNIDNNLFRFCFDKKLEKNDIIYLSPNGYDDTFLRNITEEKIPFFSSIKLPSLIELNKNEVKSEMYRYTKNIKIKKKNEIFFILFFKTIFFGAFRKVFIDSILLNNKGTHYSLFDFNNNFIDNPKKINIKNETFKNFLNKSKEILIKQYLHDNKEMLNKNNELFMNQILRIKDYYKNTEEDTLKNEFLHKINEEIEYFRVKFDIQFLGLLQLEIEVFEIKLNDNIVIYKNFFNNDFIYPFCELCGEKTDKNFFIEENKIFCKNCISKCSICGIIKSKQSLIKTEDNKIVCEQHLFKCQVCGLDFSTNFNINDTNICKKCMIKCNICGKFDLKVNLVQISDNSFSCKEHIVNQCSFCGRYLLENEIFYCEACGKAFCRNHIQKSDFDNKYYCYTQDYQSHISECAICSKKGVINTNFQKCKICNRIICNDHLDKCKKCNSYFCKYCLNEENICNICLNKDYIEISSEVIYNYFNENNINLKTDHEIIKWEVMQLDEIKIIKGLHQKGYIRVIISKSKEILEFKEVNNE